jgi:hypothetical protein
MAGIWTEAIEAFRRIRRHERYPTRSEAWHRQTARIAMVLEDVGQELDRIGASFTEARRVAYGRSRCEQQRRLDLLREELARVRAPRVLRTEAEPRPGRRLHLRFVLDVPDRLAAKSNKVLRVQALASLLPVLKKLGYRLVTAEPRGKDRDE